MHDSKYGVDVFSLFKEKVSSKVYLVNMGWLEVGNKRDRLKGDFDFSSIHTLYAKIAMIPSKPPFVSHENFQDNNQHDLWLFVNREHLIKQHAVSIEDLVLVNMNPVNRLKYRATTNRENNAMMHILYAIQWFVFSLVALFGLIKIYR